MKLASYKSDSPGGALQVVSDDLTVATSAIDIVLTLAEALQDWSYYYPLLQSRYQKLNEGEILGDGFDQSACQSPLLDPAQNQAGLPYDFTGGRWRSNANTSSTPCPQTNTHHQGRSSSLLLDPQTAVHCQTAGLQIDYIATVSVITGPVPRGVDYASAADLIRLVMLGNTMCLPMPQASSTRPINQLNCYSPVALTPDCLGLAWQQNRIHLPLFSYINDELHAQTTLEKTLSYDMAELIVKAAVSTSLPVGTILSMPLLSSCYYDFADKKDQQLSLAELDNAMVPLLQQGDQLRIEMLDYDGCSVFGAIDQLLQP